MAKIGVGVSTKTSPHHLAALLDEMLAESGGPLSSNEKRAADAALTGTPKHARKRPA